MDEEFEFRDPFDYETYSIEFYEDSDGPPLIHQRSRLICAVVQNQVEVLNELLDSPKWYKICDKFGLNLLQIAILRENREVFDYLVSRGFPLEAKNDDHETALQVALEGYVSNDIVVNEYFACKLIEKGANPYVHCKYSPTPLHCALERSYYMTAKLLIEKRVGVNRAILEYVSPLDLSLDLDEQVDEIVTALLIAGAAPSVDVFERAVLCNRSYLVQEQLFFYLFDEFSHFELSLDIIFKLAQKNSPLFYKILSYNNQYIVNTDAIYTYFRILCSLEQHYLKIILNRFHNLISEAFSQLHVKDFQMQVHDKTVNLENLDFLLQSSLRNSMINFFSQLNSARIFEDLIGLGYNESQSFQYYAFLLSYGLQIREHDVQLVYRKFGYCELFKFLLYSEFEIELVSIYPKCVIPVFVYDVEMSLERYLLNPEIYYAHGVAELVRFFANSKLNDFYIESFCDDDVRRDLPQFPLLVELARNAFRDGFIKKFNIRQSKEFFTLLSCIPISSVHKKIITFETRLY